MRFIITLCLLGWGTGFGTALANTDSSALENLLAPISSLQGTFQQTIKNEQGVELQRLSGTVSLKKPGQFRWEVLGEEPRLVVSDGKKIWDYDEDLDQVTIQRLNRSQSKTPIFFLTGTAGSLHKDFKVQQLPLVKGQCLQKSDACFELTPKGEEGSFLWIKIGFKDKRLKEMEFLDQLGQRSQFIFKNVDLNPTFSKEQFHFVPPPGIDVLQGD